MINPELDYRRLRLDVALDRLDHRVWLPFCQDPLVLIRIWVHPDGAHTFDLLITRDDPDDVSACRTTFVDDQLHPVRVEHGTVERMVSAVINLGHPPGIDHPYTAGMGEKELRMNAEPTNPPPDAVTPADLVTAQQELTAALGSIIGRGDFWRVVSASRPLTLTHGWHDGSVDTMVISGAHAAYAYRDNPSGREVHKFEGTALEVDAAIRALPAPDEPAAPDGSDHTPGPSGTWT